jgi:Ca2+-binding EF-hand superfamily protein
MIKRLLVVACILLLHHGTAAESGLSKDDEEDMMLAQMMDVMDKNKDGRISAKEFAAAADEGDADDTFKLMDADGDGFATHDEIAAFAMMMGGGEAENMHDEP